MLSILLIISIGLDVARELCFKVAARSNLAAAQPASVAVFPAMSTAQLAWIVGGALCWGVEILAWSQVLSRLPLNVAFPIMSLTYAATPLASWLLLGDRVSHRRWFGIGLVTSGVMIVGSTGIG